MALYFVGLGLDEKDLSLKGLETIKKCNIVYLENYTGVTPSPAFLEKILRKKIIPANRSLIENSDEIIENSKKEEVAFLTSGDPLVATTHIELFLRAKKERIVCRVIHAASIFSAIAETGLQLYKFGATASIPFPEKNFNPESFYDVLKHNKKFGLHTLFLLDLKPEQKRFIKINEAIELLLKIEEKRKEKIFLGKTFCVACARLGKENEKIRFARASELLKEDFGKPPYCLIVPGKLHFIEEEALKNFG